MLRRKMSLLVLILAASCASVASTAAAESGVSFYDFLKCGVNEQPITCAKIKAGRVLDLWEDGVDAEMRTWGEMADEEVISSGRQLSDLEDRPSTAAHKLQMALNELTNILQNSLYKSIARKKQSGGGVDSITISTNQETHEKKKKKQKKKKPANLHIHQQPAAQEKPEMEMEQDKGAETAVLAEGLRLEGMELDQEMYGPGKTRVKREGEDEDSDVGDARGKKKKKKKAILKLLLLGAVLKAKIGLLLQILSAHLQVKFFAIALAGLAINIARFWLDLKKGHAPQKVIYYEHAQHQHHYEHEDDQGWGGYWSRSLDTQPTKKKDSLEGIEAIHPGDELAYGGYGGWQEEQSVPGQYQ